MKQSGVIHAKLVTLKVKKRNAKTVSTVRQAKKSGVMLVKPAMQINLKSHAKSVLTKDRLAKNVKKRRISKAEIFP